MDIEKCDTLSLSIEKMLWRCSNTAKAKSFPTSIERRADAMEITINLLQVNVDLHSILAIVLLYNICKSLQVVRKRNKQKLLDK